MRYGKNYPDLVQVQRKNMSPKKMSHLILLIDNRMIAGDAKLAESLSKP